MPLYEHQRRTRDHVLEKKRSLVFSDPGTMKTASVLAAIEVHRKENGGGRALVLAPKSILEPSWVNDCRAFTPRLTIAAAYAKNRAEAFAMGTDVVVTNHDAVKWVADHPEVLEGFDFLAIDESTAYKTPTSQRSKAAAKIKDQFEYRVAMTGTPMPNGLIDIWHQVYLIDDGEHLGPRFYAFRSATHEPEYTLPGVVTWREKEGARDAVADVLSDITIRYRLRDCTDVPKNTPTERVIDLSPKLRKQYDEMAEHAMLAFQQGEVKAINAAVLANKLIQIASGSVYGLDGKTFALDTARADLIAQLCAERDHTLVAYLWHHQRDAILAALKRIGVDRVLVWDSDKAAECERDFQLGKYQVLLAHPAQASHGLTLVRANTTIWASPPARSEWFTQFNQRIDRHGQTRETETIMIRARDTIEERRYAQLQGKVDDQNEMLALIQSLTQPKEAA